AKLPMSSNDLKSRLSRLAQSTAAKRPLLTPAQALEEEARLFKERYQALAGESATAPNAANLAIPTFYQPQPKEDSLLQKKLREEARALFLQRKTKQLLDNNELQGLWYLLGAHRTPPDGPEAEQLINYTDFLKVRQAAGPKCAPFFRPRVFAKLLQDDPYGRINIMSLFNYIMKKVWLHQTRIGLSLYDFSGQGYLRETDLENYITELIPTLPQLSKLEKLFHSFYVCTAVRKFFFFLDPLRTGRIKISDILASSFLDDLLELRDEELSEAAQSSNWFSALNALRVYGTFLNLDKDENGMLSKSELAKYGTGTLTEVFLDRLFQECLTYEGELDYKSYLDFVLGMENKAEPQSLQYFFRILDIDGSGSLTVWTLNFFFRGIQQKLREHGMEPPKLSDLQNEIFDMVRPADPYKITLDDLVRCGQGDTVVNILIDLNGFWSYESREMIVADVPEEAEL
ncbi:hypothetical protein BOX15_Mlig028291g1, partial [Macrostomum lignano]